MYTDQAPRSRRNRHGAEDINIKAASEWQELVPLLARYSIQERHALSAGVVTVRVAMAATAADFPTECQEALITLQQHIQQNMRGHLSALGVSELYTMCRQRELWTPRQLYAYIPYAKSNISQRQICCIRIHRIRLHVENNTLLYCLLIFWGCLVFFLGWGGTCM